MGELGSPCSRWQCAEDVPEDREGVSQSEGCCRNQRLPRATLTSLPRPPSTDVGALVGSTLWKRNEQRRGQPCEGLCMGANLSSDGRVLFYLPVAFSCPFIASSPLLQKVKKGQEVTENKSVVLGRGSCVSYLRIVSSKHSFLSNATENDKG